MAASSTHSSLHVESNWNYTQGQLEKNVVCGSQQSQLRPPIAPPCVLAQGTSASPLEISLGLATHCMQSIAVRSTCKHIEVYKSSGQYVLTVSGKAVGEVLLGQLTREVFAAVISLPQHQTHVKLRLIPDSKNQGHERCDQIVQGILVHIAAPLRPAHSSHTSRDGHEFSAGHCASPQLLSAVLQRLGRMEQAILNIQNSIHTLQLSVDELSAQRVQAQLQTTADCSTAASTGHLPLSADLVTPVECPPKQLVSKHSG